MEILFGLIGGILLILFVIGLVLYRNWKYEQELDSLLWKIDFREIHFNEEGTQGAKLTRVSQFSPSF